MKLEAQQLAGATRPVQTELAGVGRAGAVGAAGVGLLAFAARNGILDLTRYGESVGGVTKGLSELTAGLLNLDPGKFAKGLFDVLPQRDRDAISKFALGFDPKGQRENEKQIASFEAATKAVLQLVAAREKLRDLDKETGAAAAVQRAAARAAQVQAQQVLRATPGFVRRGAFASQGLTPAGRPIQGPPPETEAARNDIDFRIKQLQVSLTDTEKDDLALLRSRSKFLARRIEIAQQDKTQTKEDKDLLERLYKEQTGAEDSINAILERQRADRKRRADERKRIEDEAKREAERIAREAAAAYREEIGNEQSRLQLASTRAEFTRKTLADNKVAIRNEIRFLQERVNDSKLEESERLAFQQQLLQAQERLRQIGRDEREIQRERYRDRLSDRQEELQIGIERAKLTEKTVVDDRRETKKYIRFLKARVKDVRLTKDERREFERELVGAQQSLKDLKGGGGGGGTDFFKEAVSNFKQFASNIAPAGGVLSPQDARGQFAAFGLSAIQEGHAQQALARAAQRSAEEQRAANGYLSRIEIILRGGKSGQGTQPAPRTPAEKKRAEKLAREHVGGF